MSHPFWFERALATSSTPGDVEVDGVRIHDATWGEVGRPGIALVHGSNAHLEWWRFVAPFLADQFRVVALDSSGNGDSGWRERYTGAQLGSRSSNRERFNKVHRHRGVVCQCTWSFLKSVPFLQPVQGGVNGTDSKKSLRPGALSKKDPWVEEGGGV